MKATQKLGSTYAITLANYILKHFGPMSHLKLQKLLYYCEAYHLACFEESLIGEDFEAWVHGPVCRPVYNSLKDSSILYSDVGFDAENDTDPDIEIGNDLNSSQKELIAAILEDLSTWTAFELETSTHSELPWIEARGGIGPSKPCSNKISKSTMLEFYRAEINDNK
jgi:uncharacterized phage-associated protein